MTIKTKNRSEITLHDERRPPRRTPPGQLTEIRDEVTGQGHRVTVSRETRPRPRRRLPRPGAAVPHRPAGPGDGPTGEEATGPLAEGVAPRPPAQSVSQSVSRSNSYNTSKRAYTGVRRSVRDATIRLVRGSGPSHSAPQPEAEFHNTHKCPAGIKGHPKTLRYTPSTAVCVCAGGCTEFSMCTKTPCWATS